MIEKHKVVSVTYTLNAAPAGEQKVLVETADESRPLQWLFGTGSMIPTFESNLLRKNTGDKFEFTIAATDAYGEHDVENIAMLPLDIFKGENGTIDTEMLQVDNMLPMTDSEGHHLNGRVLEVTAEYVKMDFNHPLAGQELHFAGSIIEVREASTEEVEHGHAHGPNGHQH
jgi:FKBP-type peptidyl-prolyl cis-trans isomerase SlyD